MLVTFWEWKLLPLNDLGKTRNLLQILRRSWLFCLARAFDLVLSLGVTTPLINPVMGISWPCSVGKVCFDMPKSIRFRDLLRLFLSSRRPDTVYLGWLCEIWLGSSLRCKLRDDQERLTRALVLLAPLLPLDSKSTSLSTGIHMWVQAVPYNLVYSGGLSSLFQHVDLVTTSLRAGFQVYLS